ncbi:MAG: hypothetical protein IPJ65_36405 [Archangiaceae bacterium]|nr:hypothetical protein [Archangiaceae bacterium]
MTPALEQCVTSEPVSSHGHPSSSSAYLEPLGRRCSRPAASVPALSNGTGLANGRAPTPPPL